MWRFGKTSKGFLFVCYKGRRVRRADFDIREPTATVGTLTWMLDPAHIYEIDKVPCAFVSDQHATTVSLEKEPGSKFQDPESVFALLVRLRDAIIADVMSHKNKWKEQALIIGAVASVVGAVLAMLAFKQAGDATSAANQCWAMANATYSKINAVFK
jgi:hypothetical protein